MGMIMVKCPQTDRAIPTGIAGAQYFSAIPIVQSSQLVRSRRLGRGASRSVGGDVQRSAVVLTAGSRWRTFGTD